MRVFGGQFKPNTVIHASKGMHRRFNGCDEQATHPVAGLIYCVRVPNASIPTSIVELSVLSEGSSYISVD